MRKRLPRLRHPRTLITAAVAAQVARTVLNAEVGPETPHGVASLDQYFAAARDALDVRGLDLDSPSEVATALAPFSAMIALADDPTPEECQLALYGVLHALSSAFLRACGEEVPS